MTEAKTSWLKRLTAGLKRSTGAISSGIGDIFTKRRLDDAALEELEDLLITADLGVSVAAKVADDLRRDRFGKDISAAEVRAALAARIRQILQPVARPLSLEGGHKPHVILMVGVNGAGKTTTIGKLARQFRDNGQSVMLAAGDTFRAAAIEQLQIWGERTGCPVVTTKLGGDPAGLAFEAMSRAEAEGADILLIDTAGRLQNRTELMDELAKIVRVIRKKDASAPHDTLIVLDASTGQNALNQVQVFSEVADISGMIMTKLDGSAKGGVLVAVAERFGLPIHAVGVGEAVDDLRPFDADSFARALVGLSDESDQADQMIPVAKP
ncbi:hypothetical protein JCM17846_24120 [Iodidimonas nitroreducens]|uniref:Signal recognition particle receptor FtsY n=1 Tax=Iodidimonas nitroreducens TaxID=1236968 RepID=A0A5A7NB66_9PROT|nr:signal recognition particle-docking protein FtsY [Iodidimonas nitroreducens]GAK34274.1 signal recognition particle receptor FtsY [alpha proteobacterium Q-1]GER04730.1 hypothetical protein JCM17846_24120 [Iodidimonas nitroreducens]